jgi:hypothetical protein
MCVLIKKLVNSVVDLGNVTENFGVEVLNNFKSVKNVLK